MQIDKAMNFEIKNIVTHDECKNKIKTMSDIQEISFFACSFVHKSLSIRFTHNTYTCDVATLFFHRIQLD